MRTHRLPAFFLFLLLLSPAHAQLALDLIQLLPGFSIEAVVDYADVIYRISYGQ